MNNPNILSHGALSNIINILTPKPISPTSRRKCWKCIQKEKRFMNKKSALEFIDKELELGITTPHFEIKTKKIKVKKIGEGNFEAKAVAEFHLSCQKSRIEIIKLKWSKMTQDEIKKVEKMTKAIISHEEGHMKIAQKIAKNMSRLITKSGATEKEAKSNLKKEMDDILATLIGELKAEEEKYDSVTDHGRAQSKGPTQGFPGGSDIIIDL